MSAVQSTIRLGSRRAFLPHFQEIQFLSRSQFASPLLLVVTLNASGPVATIVDAVTQQWQGLNNNQPLVANPTFVAAPNAVYHGEVQLPSGKVLHRSTALNVFHLSEMAKRAYRDPQQVWELEAPYPANEWLQQAMTTMSPDPRRVELPDLCDQGSAAMMPLEQFSRNGAAPAEDVVAQTLTSVSPLVLGLAIDTGIMRVAEDIGELERLKTLTFGTEDWRAAQLELAHEIYHRAKDNLN
ncbi:hypothetical protein K438DRAFT_2105204 [Mycena galopus ATCC 62051]|nr:hypothetical protein K438DRAFT_2105204 [Mycena galopus ATCC 62051]